jgi:hypothetical protein
MNKTQFIDKCRQLGAGQLGCSIWFSIKDQTDTTKWRFGFSWREGSKSVQVECRYGIETHKNINFKIPCEQFMALTKYELSLAHTNIELQERMYDEAAKALKQIPIQIKKEMVSLLKNGC